jgi:hypothetical protein
MKMNKDKKIFYLMLAILLFYSASIIYACFTVFAKTIGDDKHFSSNTSVVIGLNKTLTLSGLFINHTNGYVTFRDASMNGANAFPKIGLKPSANITIYKIGDYKLNYTSINTLIDSIYSPIYGKPYSINHGVLLSWINISNIGLIQLSALNIEMIWVNYSLFIIAIFIIAPMFLLLVLIGWRRRK